MKFKIKQRRKTNPTTTEEREGGEKSIKTKRNIKTSKTVNINSF